MSFIFFHHDHNWHMVTIDDNTYKLELPFHNHPLQQSLSLNMKAQHEIEMDMTKAQSPPRTVSSEPSTKYVLNIAFFSFIIFTIFEAAFAMIAHSQSMMADAQAMSIVALSYLFNLGA